MKRRDRERKEEREGQTGNFYGEETGTGIRDTNDRDICERTGQAGF